MEFNFSEYFVRHEGKELTGQVRDFLVKQHYKRSWRSLKPRNVFTLWHEDLLVGVCVFGHPFSRHAETVYGLETLELRRFCMINEAPRNSESFFLGRSLKALKKLSNVQRIITYADPNKGHQGVIYKATNFKYMGKEKYRQQILRYKGRDISMRQVYQKYKDGHKPGYVESALKLQQLKHAGKAKVIHTKAKHIFLYSWGA